MVPRPSRKLPVAKPTSGDLSGQPAHPFVRVADNTSAIREIHCNGGRSPASGEGTWDSSGKKYAPTSGQRVYHCPSREVILEIPGNFVLKRLSSDHNLPVDLFPRRQPLIEVG